MFGVFAQQFVTDVDRPAMPATRRGGGGGGNSDAGGLSEYEQQRLANIRRNADELDSLGLARPTGPTGPTESAIV